MCTCGSDRESSTDRSATLHNLAASYLKVHSLEEKYIFLREKTLTQPIMLGLGEGEARERGR